LISLPRHLQLAGQVKALKRSPFPAMLAGFLAPVVGVTTAADFYGAAVFLALASLLAASIWKMKR
jgi:hypothetical protein